MVTNLYKELPAYAKPEDKIINVVVDIPKYSSNKYEYNEEGWYFALDRVYYHQMFCPFDYGFIPQTHAEDGDAADVVLLVTYPTFSGCVVKARVVWMIETADESGPDNKFIAVPISKLDPRFDEIQSVEDLPAHVRQELLLHFKEIKKLEKSKYDKVVINWFKSKEEAYASIDKSIEAYKQSH